MSFNRTHQILIGALVVQLALAGVLFWPRGQATASGAPLLGQIKTEEITSVTVSNKDGARTTLAKQGDQWVLPDAGEYPADSSKVTPVLDKLAALKGNRLVTQTAASHQRLQVADDDFAAKVDLKTTGGAAYTLFVGSAAGGGSSHVRLAGKDDVYLASNLSSYDLRPDASAWVDTAYLNVPLADVVGLVIKNAGGDLSFQKDARGKWQMQELAAGEQLNQSVLDGLLNQAASVQLAKPLGKSDQAAYGLANPSAVITLKTRKDNQDKSYTLTVGSLDFTDNTYAVKSSESAYYVRVNDYGVKDFTTKKRADFLTQPTPAPGLAFPLAHAGQVIGDAVRP